MKQKVYIIDDKETIAKIASFYLSQDYETMYFENPIQAIEYMKNGGSMPDLFILDIRMPMMCGDEFLLYIKQNEQYKHIPVIMLSSEDSTSERIRLLENGANDYIVKPFNPRELKVRVKNIIG